MAKLIEKKQNNKGIWYTLWQDGPEEWSVWVLRENYDGKVRGGIRKSWRWVVNKTNEEEARKVFNRRTK